MEKTIPITLAWDESQDIGSDTETGVDDADYQPPFTFNGKIVKITLDINRPQLSPDDIKKLEEVQKTQGDSCQPRETPSTTDNRGSGRSPRGGKARRYCPRREAPQARCGSCPQP